MRTNARTNAGLKDKNKLKLGDKGDVTLERIGAGQAKLSNYLTVGLDLTVGDDLKTKFAKVTDHLTAASIKGSKLNIEGPVRITDDIRLAGPHRGDPGTIGYVYGCSITCTYIYLHTHTCTHTHTHVHPQYRQGN